MSAHLAVSVLVLAPGVLPAPGVLIDRVAAVVGDEVITQSRLNMEARVNLALRESTAVASAELDPTFLESFLQFLVNEKLLFTYALRSGAQEPTDSSVQREWDALAIRFSSATALRAFLRRFDIEPETVRTMLRRKLTVRSHVERVAAQEASRGITAEAAVEAVVQGLRQRTEIRVLKGDALVRQR